MIKFDLNSIDWESPISINDLAENTSPIMNWVGATNAYGKQEFLFPFQRSLDHLYYKESSGTFFFLNDDVHNIIKEYGEYILSGDDYHVFLMIKNYEHMNEISTFLKMATQ